MNYCNWLFDTKDKDLEREIIIDWETGKRLTFKGLQTEVVSLQISSSQKVCPRNGYCHTSLQRY